jgi:hypothetical protein
MNIHNQRWYSQVVRDLGQLPDFLDAYNNELIVARQESTIHGNIETNLKELPAQTEIRFSQLQEIEAVLNFLNIQLRKIRFKHFKKYLEGYARALSTRDAEKYVDGEDEVIDFETLINEVALLRNRYLSVMKGLEAKQWQLGHITRLRTAGMEDVSL